MIETLTYNEVIVSVENLDYMIQKFLDGETTCAEEIALENFFTDNDNLPERYNSVRDMFRWYDGMNPSELPGKMHKRNRLNTIIQRLVIWSSTVAAGVIILITVLSNYSSANAAETMSGQYNHIVRDGRLITGTDEIIGDIEATLQDGRLLEAEIDMEINLLLNK